MQYDASTTVQFDGFVQQFLPWFEKQMEMEIAGLIYKLFHKDAILIVITEELIYLIDNEDNYLEFKQDCVSQFIPWLLSTNFSVAYMTYSEDSFYCTGYLFVIFELSIDKN